MSISLSHVLCPEYTYSLIPYVALLQDKKLLDLPKLLDICAIYSHENEDLTGVLVSMFFMRCIFFTRSLPLSHSITSFRLEMQ